MEIILILSTLMIGAISMEIFHNTFFMATLIALNTIPHFNYFKNFISKKYRDSSMSSFWILLQCLGLSLFSKNYFDNYNVSTMFQILNLVFSFSLSVYVFDNILTRFNKFLNEKEKKKAEELSNLIEKEKKEEEEKFMFK